MAEKYGKKPPRFTKRWWKYFWHYYKIHTIVAVLLIIFIGTGIYNRITKPKYDLTLTYAGFTNYTSAQTEHIQNKLSKICPDTNKNGEGLLEFNVFSFLQDEKTDPEYNMAIATKFNLTIGEDEAYIYVIEKNYLDEFLRIESNHAAFRDVSEWCTADVDKDKLYMAGTKPVAISLSQNRTLKNAGILTDDTYLLIRYKPRNDQKEQVSGYKDAIKLANKIINNNIK